MYAVIDLGSNSFHLLIARRAGDHFKVVDRCSEKIQLADGLTHRGELTAAAISRGLDCLRLFRRILHRHPIEQLRVVATQALRQAVNAPLFIEQAKALGFDVEIISGRREAELVFRGICDPLPDCGDNRLAIDIGGASTELAVGRGQHIVFAESLPMGCVSWRDQFFADRIDYRERGAAAKQAALATLEPFLPKLSSLSWCESYASSGSAKMLSSIARYNCWTQGDITPDCIGKIEGALGEIGHYSDIGLEGLKPERQDLLAPGISIMATIVEALNINVVRYSDTALREGVLEEMSSDAASDHFAGEKARMLGT